jgi:hypothetical protein
LSSRLGVAVQVIAVAALAVVVYLAFLKPNDSDPLSGIQVDDGAQIEASPPRETDRNRERRRPRVENRKRDGKPRVREVGVPAPEWEPSTADAGTPVGSQYVSEVTRISQQVTRASH